MYKYFNLHPKGLEVQDCVKRAFALVSGRTYQEVSLDLNRLKYETGCKVFNHNKNWKSYAAKLGLKRISFPAKAGQSRMNGTRFCQSFPIGRYLLSMAGHLTACVDGVIHDTWDCSEKCVYEAYEFVRKTEIEIKKIKRAPAGQFLISIENKRIIKSLKIEFEWSCDKCLEIVLPRGKRFYPGEHSNYTIGSDKELTEYLRNIEDCDDPTCEHCHCFGHEFDGEEVIEAASEENMSIVLKDEHGFLWGFRDQAEASVWKKENKIFHEIL